MNNFGCKPHGDQNKDNEHKAHYSQDDMEGFFNFSFFVLGASASEKCDEGDGDGATSGEVIQ